MFLSIPSTNTTPHLPPYTGAEDPAMWVLQVKAAFDAHDTANVKQGKWMVCALRGAAMRYWFLECQQHPADPDTITSILKAKFRHYAYEFGMHAKLHQLKMQPGGYSLYADRFSDLACQLQSLPISHLMYSFLAGLTAEYRQQVHEAHAIADTGATENFISADLAQFLGFELHTASVP